MQIAFNPQYLLDGIGAIDSDVARISFTTATRPAVITGKGETQPDYRYVIMPIRSAGLALIILANVESTQSISVIVEHEAQSASTRPSMRSIIVDGPL